MLKARESVRTLKEYHPPLGNREGLRLDFNENTVGCSPKVIEYLKEKLTADALTVYPEYIDAMRELAAYFAVAPGELLLSNGTDEAIQVLINTFVDDGDDVLLLKPSYAMYRFYAELAGASVREIDYAATDLEFPLDEFIAAIRPSTRAILIANPNNPTGTGINLDAIRRILEAAPQAAVLIDEAYFEFCGVTALPLVRQYPNLFVSRTFSKVFGMAAMRCGCLFSSVENVRWMHKAQSPYSVNMLAALAARAAIQDRQHVALGLAPPQRVFALHRGHGLNHVRAPNRLHAGLRESEVPHLTFHNQILDGARDVLDWHLRIHAVLIQQIDDVDLEPAQRSLGDFADVRRPTV